jgi:hypothetical protein
LTVEGACGTARASLPVTVLPAPTRYIFYLPIVCLNGRP